MRVFLRQYRVTVVLLVNMKLKTQLYRAEQE